MRIEDVSAQYFSEELRAKGLMMIRVYSGAAGDVEEFQTNLKFPMISGGTHPFAQSAPPGKPGVLRIEQLKDTAQEYTNFRVFDYDIYDLDNERKKAEVGELENLWSTPSKEEGK